MTNLRLSDIPVLQDDLQILFFQMRSKHSVQQVQIKRFSNIIIKTIPAIYLVNIGVAAQRHHREVRIFTLDFFTNANALLTINSIIQHYHMRPGFINEFEEVLLKLRHRINNKPFEKQRCFKYFKYVSVSILNNNFFHNFEFI